MLFKILVQRGNHAKEPSKTRLNSRVLRAMKRHHLYKMIKASVHNLTNNMLTEGVSDELNFAHLDPHKTAALINYIYNKTIGERVVGLSCSSRIFHQVMQGSRKAARSGSMGRPAVAVHQSFPSHKSLLHNKVDKR